MLCTLPLFGQIAVTYLDHGIAVAGARPNGKVAVYGICHSRDVTELLVRENAVVRADADGKVVYAVQQPAFQSVFVIFDLTSGDYAVSSPPGYRAPRIAPPAGSLGSGDGIRTPWTVVDVFVARRGAGAWSGRGADRQRSGFAAVPVQALSAIERGGPPPPRQLAPGDVVFAIDVDDMEFWTLKVTPADVKGAPDAH